MNDLEFGGDLRAALDRDADLVGAPSPDLLDQLSRRRQHQRRQRVALMGAVAAVVVVAAGIPIGVSLAASPAPAPATQPVAPTPSVTPEVVPTTPPAAVTTPAVPTPTGAMTPSATATSARATASATATPAPDPAPPCPTIATLLGVLPAPTAEESYSFDEQTVLCSGTWAAAFPTLTLKNMTDDKGNPMADVGQEYTAVFHWNGRAWEVADREQSCPTHQVPADIYQGACETN